MAIDPETKSSIESILSGKKGRSVPPRASSRSWDPPDWKKPEETWTERLEREERERKERVEREERERKWREERAAAEAKSRAEADEREKYEIKTRYEQLFQKGSYRSNGSLKEEIATLSINPSKACVVLRAVVNQAFVNDLERLIDSKHRKELSDVWEFHPSVLPKLKQLLAMYYKEVQVFGVPKTVPSTKFDKLMEKLDKEDRSKVYRLLSSKYHPDIKPTGSHEIMTLINEVFKS